MKTYCSMILMAALSTACTNRAAPFTPRAPVNEEPSMKTRSAAMSRGSAETDITHAKAVVDFWREAGPGLWFAKDPAFDARFRERFLSLHELAAEGRLRGWLATPEGALGLLILLDQFPRNAFRGTPRMYETDVLARELADAALAIGHDRATEEAMRIFIYLPFGHSEDLADQERSVALNRQLGEDALRHAEGHRDIVRRFGRFPHRNPILGRTMTADEQRFLDEGGFSG